MEQRVDLVVHRLHWDRRHRRLRERVSRGGRGGRSGGRRSRRVSTLDHRWWSAPRRMRSTIERRRWWRNPVRGIRHASRRAHDLAGSSFVGSAGSSLVRSVGRTPATRTHALMMKDDRLDEHLHDVGREIVAAERLRFGDRAKEHGRWRCLTDAKDFAEHRDGSRHTWWPRGSCNAQRSCDGRRSCGRKLTRRWRGLTLRSASNSRDDRTNHEKREEPHGSPTPPRGNHVGNLAIELRAALLARVRGRYGAVRARSTRASVLCAVRIA